MKNTITLTHLKGEDLTLDKSDVRVIENLSGGALITLTDGTQYHVMQDVQTVLDLIKAKGPK